MAEPSTVRLDLRAVLPIAALGVVVLVIIFVELCGREDVAPLSQTPLPSVESPTPSQPVPTATAGPSPTPAPPTSTPPPSPGGGERDLTRLQDLATIQDALEEYREENGSYPDNDGNVQSLCVFPDTDAGCELEDVLSSIPNDPLGEPLAENGYWYASDGDTFTVYAQRESEEFGECAEHPDHLGGIDSLLCVRGP
jgi:hypothetical protein